MLYVTAFYISPHVAHRSLEAYLTYGRLLVAASVPLRVHTTPEVAEILQNSWKDLPTAHVELCTDIPMEPYWLMNVTLPAERNEVKDTAFFLSVQLTKLKLCASAPADLVAWVDFGIFHVVKDVAVAQQNLRGLVDLLPASGRRRLLSPTAWAPGAYEIWDFPCWRHLGGFVLGSRDAFMSAYLRQRTLVGQHLPRLTWEVNYWAMMDDEFDGYQADHDDSLISNAVVALESPQLTAP